MIRTRLGGAACLTFVLTVGCSSPDPAVGTDAEPSRSVGPTAAASEDLGELRAAADLAPCPRSDGQPSSASDLPAVELACLGGGPDVAVAGLVGTPYVVNFWASDCAPCRDEGPYLQEMYEAAAGEVGVLGVNFLDPGGDGGALAGAREFGMRFPILFDPDGLLGAAFDIPGLPTTFFVDADGTIVGQQIGAFDSADELRAAIDRELGIRL